MKEFFNIQQIFNKNSVSKISKTKFKSYEISWKFEGFPDLVSKPSFLTYLQTSFDYQFSTYMIDAIENEIDEIRHLYKTVDQAAQTYLNEIGILDAIVKGYNRFLLNAYTDIRDFINESFIQWVFYNALHENWKVGTQEYDTDQYYKYRFEKFKLNFQTNLKKVIKTLKKNMPKDETIALMLQAYENDMNEKELLVLKMKQEAEKEELEN